MHKLEELKEMLMRELEDLTKKGELSAGSLDAVEKLTHSIKSLCYIIEEMEGEEGSSGARGRGRSGRRDSMGRFSSEGGSYDGGQSYGGSYDGGQSMRRSNRSNRSGRYSRDKEEIVEQLRELEMNAEDSEMKRMIQNWMRQAEQ